MSIREQEPKAEVVHEAQGSMANETTRETTEGLQRMLEKQNQSVEQSIVDAKQTAAVWERLGMKTKKEREVNDFIEQLPREGDAIATERLRHIGAGGMHDVFENPDDPRFVLKKVKRPAIDSAHHEEADLVIAQANRDKKTLTEYFGEAHCLKEMMARMPLTEGGVISERYVTVQEKSDVFQNPTKQDVSVSYIEYDEAVQGEKKEAYSTMNRDLLTNSGSFDEKAFLALNGKLEGVFRLMEEDAEFLNSVRNFLLRYSAYLKATGNFIDMAGKDNVMFSRQNGKWSFTLGSVMKGDTKADFEEAFSELNGDADAMDERKKNSLLNGLASTRLLNAMGIKAGIGQIVDMNIEPQKLDRLNSFRPKKKNTTEVGL